MSYRALPLRRVQIADDFWSPRIRMIHEQTLPFQYAQLETTGRLEALRLQWQPGQDAPHIFWDSDVAKWIEAASYVLATDPDAELDARVDGAIALLAAAQQPDGYLNTYFTSVEPEHRWTDLRDAHELYCAGHLIEAGVAHFEATGKRTLLDVVSRYADYIDTVFGRGPGQKRGYPGHEEIELALVKLFRATGNESYLQLAAYFVDERGRQPFYFEQEEAERGTPGYFGEHFATRADEPEYFRQYNQSHAPVREQSDAVGHAVRAMYLYCAMADLAAENGDQELVRACERLWTSVTARRMYVTGGIGSTARIEGFTADYDLPNETAYAETCAAIGLVFWAHRMSLQQRHGRYTDALERALYNGVLSGISADGKRFFYENPLASGGEVHRQEWFGVACCPPNLARLLTSLGQYVYAQSDEEAVVHLYVGGSGTFEFAGHPVTVRQETQYPWDGGVRLTVGAQQPVRFALALYVPGWCDAPELRVNGDASSPAEPQDGYLRVEREWRDGDQVELTLPMPVRRVYAHPAVAAASGCVALARGPLVYCMEGMDNEVPLHELSLRRDAPLAAERRPDLPADVAITGTGRRESEDGWQDVLYRPEPPDTEETRLVAVPYHCWDNREPGPMRVWVRES